MGDGRIYRQDDVSYPNEYKCGVLEKTISQQ
jgi:hypothetical protein